jgi:hypothetical protein
MGLFLDLMGIIGRNDVDVESSLKNYLNSVSGGLEMSDIDSSHKNFCVIESKNDNTTIFYPAYFTDWYACSQFISKDLSTTVFSCHIHDGDLWMYTMYVNGEIKDRFCPIPDYWDENISQEEIESWSGNAGILAQYIPGLKTENIEKYLVKWDLDKDEQKAYPDDEFTNCDWQLVDFLRKLNLPYPMDNEEDARGKIFKMWTKDLPLDEKPIPRDGYIVGPATEKPWWKLW